MSTLTALQVIGATAALAASVLGIINGIKIKALHIIVNSRLSELLVSTRTGSLAEGTAAGRAAEKSDELIRRSQK